MRNGWKRWWIAAVLGLSAGLGGLGCDIDEEPVTQPDRCPGPTKMVGGDWLLTGSGQRIGCDDARYNTGSFRFEAQGFRVAQNGSALLLQPLALPPDVYFTMPYGGVTGSCVNFGIQEGSDDGPDLTMDFEGTVVDEGRIAGKFEGSGPPGCRSEGTFRIKVICCAGTGPDGPTPDIVQPGEDAGPTDVAPDAPQGGAADVAPETAAPVDVAADVAAGDAVAVADVSGDLADAAAGGDAAAPTDAAVAADGVGGADGVTGSDGAGSDDAASPPIDTAGSGGGNGGGGTDAAGGFCAAAPTPAAAPPLLLALALLLGLLHVLHRRAHDRKN